MMRRTIPFVLAEAVARTKAILLVHHAVSRYLGDYGGCGDGHTRGIALDYRQLGYWNRGEAEGIYQQVFRADAEVADRAGHRQAICCPQSYDVYQSRRNNTDSHSQRRRVDYTQQFLSHTLDKHLAVAQRREPHRKTIYIGVSDQHVGAREDDSPRYQRSRPGTAPRFVHPCYMRKAI